MNIKRNLLWVVFAASMFMLWTNWESYSHPPVQEHAENKTDKKSQSHDDAQSLPNSVASEDADAAKASDVPDTVKHTPDSEKVKIITDILEVTFDTRGAQLIKADVIDRRTKDQSEKGRVTLLEKGSRQYTVQSGLLAPSGQKVTYPNQNTPFKLVSEQTKLSGEGQLPVIFEAESGGVKLTRTYTFNHHSFRIDVHDEVENISDGEKKASVYYQITRDSNEPPNAAGFYKAFSGFALYSDEGRFQKVGFDDIDDNDMDYVKQAQDGWISFIQHFFVTAWVPEKGKNHHVQIRKLGDKDLYAISATQPLGNIEPGKAAQAHATLWVGPQEQEALAKIDDTLDLVVDYGWLTIIAKPMFTLMTWIHSFVGNWGWTIILLTFIIKLALYPLSATSYKSMAKMKKFAPRMKALKEQYGDDRQQLNQAMMQMYRSEKINPLGGCLPMLMQIPIFFTLYHVILASVELRGAPWLGWITDLAQHDPYYILPIIMTGTMFLQFKLNPTPPDPTQAKIMMIMPLVFGAMMFMFPSGLVLYWTVNNILSIAQQQWITRRLNRGAANDETA